MNNQITTTSSEASQKEQNQIILYRPNETISLEVRLENETVWLSQAQIVTLFNSTKSNISEHIKHIYTDKELEKESTVRFFRTVQQEGKRTITRNIAYYNLDVIISIGFRVNTKQGILFRQWANKVLKEYLLRGYAINQRINLLEDKIDRKFAEHDAKIESLNKQVDFFVQTSIPPSEGVFHNGQIFDAYKFVTDLIKSAKKNLVLIDNYVDESVLLMLSKRETGVSAKIYTANISKQLTLDLAKHNKQYPPIEIFMHTTSHDRFLIIDDAEVYHIGASLKDLGKKLFAFSKLNIPPGAIL